MGLWRFASTSVGALLLAAGMASSVPPAVAAAKIVVDDDRVECPQAGFTTITHFSDPVSHTAEFNGMISGLFEPNRVGP
jgi:hypothetical protein